MSETLDPMAAVVDQQQGAEQLLAQPQEQGVHLIGPNGLLNQVATDFADGAGLSAAVREYITGEHLAQQRSGDSSGRLEGARNV